tara:strand:+ start:26 stop:142 length:117 start_codon:yes stop_codon:yes gene_type:complete
MNLKVLSIYNKYNSQDKKILEDLLLKVELTIVHYAIYE